MANANGVVASAARLQLQLSCLFLLISVSSAGTLYAKLPRLSLFGASARGLQAAINRPNKGDDPVQWFNYTQTLDHFNYNPESYTTFQQRYAVNSQYWGGANTSSPIFLLPGDEADIEHLVYGRLFVPDLASRFKALLVYVEHRYYGQSFPFGSKKEAQSNSTTLGYFSSAQALADYAEVMLYIKKNLSAEGCPVIAMGGSYGGMLAAWFRLKYPHIAMGALASSAPILYFDDITPQNGYYSVVSKDFMEASKSCYSTIRQSWFDVDLVASLPDGLQLLNKKFNICSSSPLTDAQQLKDNMVMDFAYAAQYNNPPTYYVNRVCDAIDGTLDTDTLGKVFAGLVAGFNVSSCISLYNFSSNDHGWDWQTCSELVIPIGCGEDDTMFQAEPFDLKSFTEYCQLNFGVTPRPHWITTEFGGHNISFVLEKFASNIIFSNGLRDPYSSGGVLKNISNSVVALHTKEGAHCLDLLAPDASDPVSVVEQRNREIEILELWLLEYYYDKGSSH